MEVNEEDTSRFDPSFKKTNLSYDEKLAVQTGLDKWDTKFQDMINLRTQELEA